MYREKKKAKQRKTKLNGKAQVYFIVQIEKKNIEF